MPDFHPCLSTIIKSYIWQNLVDNDIQMLLGALLLTCMVFNRRSPMNWNEELLVINAIDQFFDRFHNAVRFLIVTHSVHHEYQMFDFSGLAPFSFWIGRYAFWCFFWFLDSDLVGSVADDSTFFDEEFGWNKIILGNCASKSKLWAHGHIEM